MRAVTGSQEHKLLSGATRHVGAREYFGAFDSCIILRDLILLQTNVENRFRGQCFAYDGQVVKQIENGRKDFPFLEYRFNHNIPMLVSCRH